MNGLVIETSSVIFQKIKLFSAKRMMMKNAAGYLMILLIFVLLAMPRRADAGEAALTLSTTGTSDGRLQAQWEMRPRYVRLSDTVTLTLRLEYDESIRPKMPEFDTTLGDFDVAGVTDGITAMMPNRVVRELVLTLVPQRAGPLDIWPIPIRYAETAHPETTQTLLVPACRIDVTTPVAAGRVSLDDIGSKYGPLERSRRLPVWAGLLAAILLPGLAVAALLLWRRWHRVEESAPLSPREMALARLQMLRDSRLHESDVRRFFIELTAIVRVYIEQMTGIRAPERTTEEFLREIGCGGQERLPFDAGTRERLRGFLEAADRVKFARAEPSPPEIDASFAAAFRFVDEPEDQAAESSGAHPVS